jgi:hypothetical protein
VSGLSPKILGGFCAFVVKLQGQVLMDLNGSLCMAIVQTIHNSNKSSNSTYTKGMLSRVGAAFNNAFFRSNDTSDIKCCSAVKQRGGFTYHVLSGFSAVICKVLPARNILHLENFSTVHLWISPLRTNSCNVFQVWVSP